MKKTLLLTIISIVLFSCNKEKPIKNYLIISGKIENFKKKEITLTGFDFNKKIKFNKKTKSFSDTIKINRDGYYTLILQSKKAEVKLYLKDTVNTNITIDYKKPDAVKFKGTNANINNYFVQKRSFWKKQLVSANKYFALEETVFLDKVEKYKDALTELLIAKNLPTDFLKKEIKNIDYDYLRNLSNYEDYYRYLNDDKDFVVSENFPDPFHNFNYNSNKDYVNSFSYRVMLGTQLETITKNKEADDYYLTYLTTVNNKVTDSLVKNDLLYKDSKLGITRTDNLKEYYDKFITYSTNKEHKNLLSKSYNLLKVTAKGQPSPKFKGFENYAGGTTSLDDLLGKGKYLYIDVWATWCSSCKRETPLLKKLEEDYHGKNIEFVSINVDSKNLHEKWKQTIVDREMTGVQLFSGKKPKDLEWAQKFLIKGLPKFIIIDTDGNIVNPNAPAPSQGDRLINVFDDLNI
ncbi:TlpA family protein disulfide reductase [Tenacibaculum ovolyticum]|uniref:TlpA family protein disulfide reductase n=1 Tax=Tenacibaculum ovolyticum TaxID=104270 RepID=UPI003BAD4EC9